MVDFECKSRYGWEDFLEIMRLLRSPGGCPWDMEQTHSSIRNDLIEETYEVVEALAPQVRAFLRAHGPAFSEDLPDLGQADWYWSRTSGARATMESLLQASLS